MPSYYMEHGGAVLVSTINRYTFASLAPRTDQEIQIQSIDFDVAVKYHVDDTPTYDGVLDLAKAAVRQVNSQHSRDGFDLYLQSDAPAGSGLGGSAALTIAVMGALAEHAAVRLDGYEMAELAYDIERVDLGISGGKQDQYACAFGGFNLIEFSRDGVLVNPLRVPHQVLNDLEYHLMLCYTGRTRLSAGLIDKQEQHYRDGRPETIEGLHSLHQMSYEMKDALLRGRLGDFAELLDAAWTSKVRVNPDTTDSHIDEMYHTARRNGAIGGKLLGAGGGGYLLLFCEGGKKRRVREKLEELNAQFAEFSFVDGGVQVWRSGSL